MDVDLLSARARTAGRCVLLVAVLLVSSCGIRVSGTHKAYGGPDRPPDAIAVIEARSAYIGEVDGIEVPASVAEVHVLPGEHTVTFGGVYQVSVLINPRGWDRAVTTARFAAEPGHRYTVNFDRTRGPGYRVFLWVEDEATGEWVSGTGP